MRELDDLQIHWKNSGRYRAVKTTLCLDEAALTLGAGTVLAKRKEDGGLEIEGREARILTLLSVAHGAPVDSSVLNNLRQASKHARLGDMCMAAMHVALTKLPQLLDASDAARRLFIADGLIAAGVEIRTIWDALGFDPALSGSILKYNPNEPRNPKGEQKASGEWASSRSAGIAESPVAIVVRTAREWVEQDASEIVENVAERVPKVPLWLGPLTFFSALFYSTSADGIHAAGSVPGRPDLLYSWNQDEAALLIRRATDGTIVLDATLGPGGIFRDRRTKASIARLLGDHVFVDPAALPLDDPRSDQQNNNQPQECPEPPREDKPQGSDRSKAYVTFMKPIVNQPPTDPGMGYRLFNPFAAGAPVNYDDCQRLTGTLVEYKGPTYAEQLVNPYYGEKFRENVTEEWLDEATRQVEASGGRPIRWYFAEQPAMDFAHDLFSKHAILRRIELVYAPLPENWEWK